MHELIITLFIQIGIIAASLALGWQLRGDKASQAERLNAIDAQLNANSAYYEGFQYAVKSFTPKRDKEGRFIGRKEAVRGK
jgi:type II secretory pathway pseudopilin PulG